MFTGIVEEMGVIKTLDKGVSGTRLSVLASAVLDDLAVGASISINGA